MPTAEIITIGTEILLGEIVDTNTRYLARTLRGLGVDLYRTITIGDNVERIAEAIRQSMQRADIVITTGGLGPTIDDPTREAVARAFGVATEFRPELWEQILTIIQRYGRTPSENQKRQACVPAGALAIQNPVGTAPAFIMEFTPPLPPGEKPVFKPNSPLPPGEGLGVRADSPLPPGEEPGVRADSPLPPGEKPVFKPNSPLPPGEGLGVRACTVISLPGVPKEMEYLLHEAVIPYLQKRYHLDQVIKVRLLHTAGAPEADIDEKIGEFETLSNPTVGLAAHTGIVDIRIAAKAATEAEADHMIAELETKIRQRLGDVVFGADEDTLESAALRAASNRTWNLVAAESGLGGSLKRRLANVGAQNLLTVESADLGPGELSTFLETLRAQHNARAALGIAAFPETQTVEMALLTPEENKVRQLPFGGHPALLPRWAVNLALNWLRRTAEKSE